MSGTEWGLVVSVFLACAVEAVEALTVVLAVGITRSWHSSLGGAGAAVLALGALVAALGPAITALPLTALRLVVGGLLLVFGLQWLRKSVLRASGLKALHDEAAAFAEEAQAARAAGRPPSRWDGYSFTIAFKGVLLEGLEVVFIALTFGANQHRVGLAAIAAGAAVVLVALVGVAIHAPLTRVPENAMKFSVGVMLTSFGTFWGAEGAGALARRRRRAAGHRPGRGARRAGHGALAAPGAAHACRWRARMSAVRRAAQWVWDFVVGDDWVTAAGVVVALGLTAIIAGAGATAWWVMPVAVVALLGLSLRRAAR